MSEGENLGFELETRSNGRRKGGEQGHKQRGHAGRERYQCPGRICNGDERFGISGKDRDRLKAEDGDLTLQGGNKDFLQDLIMPETWPA
jgi:hypothetical protein